ncbi:MAG: dienelactone hydrolase family protein [Paucibacter sp.]|nr:dienelactone hydrolase family protein [Roseateles sp.]
MSLEFLEGQTGPDPTATIIVLHGLGADGNDFVPIAQQMDLSAVGHVRYVFPSAPVRPVTINNGYRMRAWYDILGMDLVRREDEAGLRNSQAEIEALIALEVERGIPARRIVLMGFSQGCAMTLMTGLRHPERLAGLVCLSGYLPLADKIEAERHAANADVPIFMAHGLQDPVVQFARGQASYEHLKKLGYSIDWHDYPMPHSVCAQEVDDLAHWLREQLA